MSGNEEPGSVGQENFRTHVPIKDISTREPETSAAQEPIESTAVNYSLVCVATVSNNSLSKTQLAKLLGDHYHTVFSLSFFIFSKPWLSRKTPNVFFSPLTSMNALLIFLSRTLLERFVFS